MGSSQKQKRKLAPLSWFCQPAFMQFPGHVVLVSGCISFSLAGPLYVRLFLGPVLDTTTGKHQLSAKAGTEEAGFSSAWTLPKERQSPRFSLTLHTDLIM